MTWTMSERRILVLGIAGRYQQSQKKVKGRILDESVQMTGYQRNYASRLLPIEICFLRGSVYPLGIGE